MSEQNDHDILISIQTKMDTLISNQSDSIKQHQELAARVAVLENKDSRDSEKFKGLTEEIRRSLNNAGKIDSLTADVNNLGERVRELRSKAGLWDIANAIGAAIAAAIAWFK